MYLVSFQGDTLCVSMKALNIHKGTPQNDSPYDLEIEEASVTFSGVQILSFNPHGEDGEPVYTGADAPARLSEALTSGVTLYDLDKADGETHFLDAFDYAPRYPFFTVHFTFTTVSIEWDKYLQKAWYESEAFRQYFATKE